MFFLFKWVIFRFRTSFPGCRYSFVRLFPSINFGWFAAMLEYSSGNISLKDEMYTIEIHGYQEWWALKQVTPGVKYDYFRLSTIILSGRKNGHTIWEHEKRWRSTLFTKQVLNLIGTHRNLSFFSCLRNFCPTWPMKFRYCWRWIIELGNKKTLMILLWNTLIPDMKVPNHDFSCCWGGGNLHILLFSVRKWGKKITHFGWVWFNPPTSWCRIAVFPKDTSLTNFTFQDCEVPTNVGR